MSTRFLHVANGTSTTRLIAAAGIPGALSLWADPLHEGPVPGHLTDAELLEVRRRYLTGPGEASIDPVNDLRRWRAVVEEHAAYDELVLWFEHDLFDQLNLVQLLEWVHRHVPMEKPLSQVSIDAFPGHPEFKGLGELAPGDMVFLLTARQPVSGAQFGLAGQAWRAFREPTPESLDAFRRSDTTALPFLSRAVTRLLHELPWTTDGLSRTERQFLRLAAAGPSGLRVGAPANARRGGRVLHYRYHVGRSLRGAVEDHPAATARGSSAFRHRARRARRPGRPGRGLWHRLMARRHTRAQRQRVAVG